MNFKTTTEKDMFHTKLRGEKLNFDYVTVEDKSAFIDFAIKHNMLKFVCYKEYMGILGLYNVLKDFSFNIDREDGMSDYKQYIGVHAGDQIEITELFPLRGDMCHLRGGGKRYNIYKDVSDKERARIYERTYIPQ